MHIAHYTSPLTYTHLCLAHHSSPRDTQPLGHPQLIRLEPCSPHLRHFRLLSIPSTCVPPFLCPQHYSKPNHHVPRLQDWRQQGLSIPPPVSPISSQPIRWGWGGGLHKSGFDPASVHKAFYNQADITSPPTWLNLIHTHQPFLLPCCFGTH